MRLRSLFPIFGLLVLVMGVISCGNRATGWAVFLWSHDEERYATGSVVAIYDSSTLNNTFAIRQNKKQDLEQVPQWRLQYYKRKSAADEAAAAYAPMITLYAIAKENGLPVREKQDQDAKRVYKLREREIVKILEKDSSRSSAGEYEGHWYRVLTENGVSGYTFDLHLQISTLDSFNATQVAEERDEFLDLFLNTNFRPELFLEMVQRRRIDLEVFSPELGIFPDPENKTIVIAHHSHTTELTYETIEKSDDESYAFIGSTLLMVRRGQNTVNVQYSDAGVQYSEFYIYIGEDIDLHIIQEQERRDALYESLREAGSTLESNAYGVILLQDNGDFIWDNYDSLVPDVLTSAAGKTGTVDFPFFFGDEYTGGFPGAVSFIFDTGERINLLYTIQTKGIQFKYIPQEIINANTIEKEGNSSIVIFFTTK